MTVNAAAAHRLARRWWLTARRRFASQNIGLMESSFRGRGLAFSECRPFEPGDDPRSIDPRLSAQMGHPFVTLFAEERERIIWLLVDTSPSMSLSPESPMRRQVGSSKGSSKSAFAAEMAGLLALAGALAHDRAGLWTFGGPTVRMRPARGEAHAFRLAAQLADLAMAGPTRFKDVAHQLPPVPRPAGMVFVLSDFLFDNAAIMLGRLARHHQVVAIAIHEPIERQIPNIGIARFRDSETGRNLLVDTGSKKFREAFARQSVERERKLRASLAHWRVPLIVCTTDRPAADWLGRFFH